MSHFPGRFHEKGPPVNGGPRGLSAERGNHALCLRRFLQTVPRQPRPDRPQTRTLLGSGITPGGPGSYPSGEPPNDRITDAKVAFGSKSNAIADVMSAGP